MSRESLGEMLKEAMAEAARYENCMSLSVDSEHGHAVELHLDTSRSTYGEWIPGEGGDICLIRDRETDKVVGVRLPLMNNRLVVSHDDGVQVRINEGFLKEE